MIQHSFNIILYIQDLIVLMVRLESLMVLVVVMEELSIVLKEDGQHCVECQQLLLLLSAGHSVSIQAVC